MHDFFCGRDFILNIRFVKEIQVTRIIGLSEKEDSPVELDNKDGTQGLEHKEQFSGKNDEMYVICLDNILMISARDGQTVVYEVENGLSARGLLIKEPITDIYKSIWEKYPDYCYYICKTNRWELVNLKFATEFDERKGIIKLEDDLESNVPKEYMKKVKEKYYALSSHSINDTSFLDREKKPNKPADRSEIRLLKKCAKLNKKGILTDEEFQSIKGRIINRM